MRRRQFINRCALLSSSIAVVMASPFSIGCAKTCKNLYSRSYRKRMLADLHVHPMLESWIRRTAVGINLSAIDDQLFGAMNPSKFDWEHSYTAGVDMICVAHFNPFDEFLSMPVEPNPDAVRNTINMMRQLEEEVATNQSQYAAMVKNHIQLEEVTNRDKNSTDYKIAVVHALEGGHALGGDLNAIELLAKKGVAMIGITHFFNKVIASSANSIPFFPDHNSLRTGQGLSEFGLEVVRKMESTGMIVDVTHATATTIDDVLQNTTRPLVSSHSAARNLGDHPYSLLDEHIQQIAADGGMVGVILMPYWLSNYTNEGMAKKEGTLDDVVKTIRYIYKICNYNHKCIGIGTDFAGFITPPADLTCYGDIDKLYQKLLLEFDGDDKLVADIMANNAINFFKENWRTGVY